MYLVYCHTNKTNGKKYYGITSGTIEKRAGSHGKLYRSSPYFFSAIQKDGWDMFEHAVIADNLTIEQASELERNLIAEHDTMNPDKGYNLHIGGFPTTEECNKFQSSSRVDKIRNTIKSQRSSEEYRAIMATRMATVWQERRDFMLSRHSPESGKPKIKVRVEELGVVFNSKAECARFLGIHKSLLSTKRANARGTAVVVPENPDILEKYKTVTVCVVNENVDVKESELLEACQDGMIQPPLW